MGQKVITAAEFERRRKAKLANLKGATVEGGEKVKGSATAKEALEMEEHQKKQHGKLQGLIKKKKSVVDEDVDEGEKERQKKKKKNKDY